MSPSVQGRRRFLLSNLTAAASLAALPELLAAPAEEALYNGIRLPSPWPPRINDVPAEPAVPPYLTSPPDVIPIDVGRQLFVADRLDPPRPVRDRSWTMLLLRAARPLLPPGDAGLLTTGDRRGSRRWRGGPG